MEKRDDRSIRSALEDAQGEVKDLRAELVDTRQTLESDLEKERRVAAEKIAELESKNEALAQMLAFKTNQAERTTVQQTLVYRVNAETDSRTRKFIRVLALFSTPLGILAFMQCWKECMLLNSEDTLNWFGLSGLLFLPAVIALASFQRR